MAESSGENRNTCLMQRTPIFKSFGIGSNALKIGLAKFYRDLTAHCGVLPHDAAGVCSWTP
jgi:hypothetical protein